MTSHVLLYVSDVLYALLALVLLAIVGVSVALCRNVYRRALVTYAMRLNTAARRLRSVHGIFAQSMAAEEDVARVLRKAGWQHVYLRRRVAVARVGHNREIDVVAVGPVVLVVEVKHWQGNVWSNGPRWFQQPNPRQGQRVLEFEDVQEDNLVKAAALRRYLENSCRIALPDLCAMTATASASSGGSSSSKPDGTWYTDGALHKYCGQCIVPVVVFTNARVRLDPATVRAKQHVYTLDSFRAFAAAVLRDGGVVAAATEVDDNKGNGNNKDDKDKASAARRRRGRHHHQQQQQQQQQQQGEHNTAAAEVHEAATAHTSPLLSPLPRRWLLLWLRALGCRNGSDTTDGTATNHNNNNNNSRSNTTATRVTLDSATQQAVAHAVHVLRTWDLLYLHDGRLITGDVQVLSLPSVGCRYARKQLLDMRIHGSHTGAAGVARLLLANNAGSVELLLTPAEQYKQQQRQEQRQRQQQQQPHSCSNSSTTPIKYDVTCDADGRVVLPVAPLRRHMEQTDRVSIKVAGASKLAVVPLVDVREVFFSQHHHAAEQQLLEAA